MKKRFSSDLLRSLRNDIPIDDVIRVHCNLACTERHGRLCFLCPRCREFHTATNPRTNLARCFHCGLNFNPIDIVMAAKECTFQDAVDLLSRLCPPRREQTS